MAKYSKKAQNKVGKVMDEYKQGKLKSGKDGKGGKVKSREQAIAIGLSEARKEGAKVPRKKSDSTGKTSGSSSSKKTTAKKSTRSSSNGKKKSASSSRKSTGRNSSR